jgi:Uma2 family endonuclease
MATSEAKQGTGLTWEEVCSDPNLQDLPYKIETNDRGQIVMSPTYAWHGKYAFRIAQRLEELLPEGEASVETAIQTAKGTKVADAIWCTAKRWDRIKDAYDVPVAPQICVEVRSPTNTDAEIDEKRQLYLDAGAEEVWICAKDGSLTFYDFGGAIESSHRAPSFPRRIEA